MTERIAKPRNAAARIKEAARSAFWICIGLAVFFGFISFLGIFGRFVGNIVDNATNYVGERVLPDATREFLLWFANDELPQLAPFLKWANAFGATWNGLLTFVSFCLAVLSIVLAFALSRDKKGN